MGPDVHSGSLTRDVAPTASEAQEPATSTPRRPLLRDYTEAILVAVIFALFVRTFLFQAYQVPTSSMERNVLAGDHLIVNKFLYAPHGDHRLSRLLPYRALQRGDVFVFRFPPDPRRDYVKRAIALSGDAVAIRDKVVFVNGLAQDEPRVLHTDERVWPDDPETPEEYRQRDQIDPVPVPLGTVFALGDNRDASYDSRFWGPVPLENVRGRALFVYWSFPVRPASDAGLRRFFSVLLHFFDRTRWERIFRPVR